MERERATRLGARAWTDAARTGGGLDPWVVATAAARLRAAFMGRMLRRLGRRLSRATQGVIVEPLRRRRERAAAYRELMAKDDRLLRDIGITRAQIPFLIDGLMQPRGEPPRRRRRGEGVYGAVTAADDRVGSDPGAVRGEVSVIAAPQRDEERTAAGAAGGSYARAPVNPTANDERGSGAAA